MWTGENHSRYDRSRLRYPSDLTDAEWALIEPCIPPSKRGGRWRTVDLRDVIDGLMDVLSTGCQRRAVPKDLLPRSTLHDYLGYRREAARWSASTTRSISSAASRRVARPVRPPASSTARESRVPKKGGLDRSARVHRR